MRQAWKEGLVVSGDSAQPPAGSELSPLQGAVPKGNATKEFIESLQLKPGQVVYKCPKCCSIKPDRAHHCRYVECPLCCTWAPPRTCVPWAGLTSWYQLGSRTSNLPSLATVLAP